MIDDDRGVLHPERLPAFERIPAAAALSDRVQWFWVPQWDLADGVSLDQEVISYPAANLVVEDGALKLYGVTTRATVRRLEGHGWAVGALLRPAAFGTLAERPEDLLDGVRDLADQQEVVAAVTAAMSAPVGDPGRAAQILGEWLAARVPPAQGPAADANRLLELLLTRSDLLLLDQAAAELGWSVRSIQRIARRWLGVAPAAVIRRRRLQEAAQRVRTEPDLDLAEIAADLGYSDHAHLSRDFAAILGVGPRDYRRGRR